MYHSKLMLMKNIASALTLLVGC